MRANETRPSHEQRNLGRHGILSGPPRRNRSDDAGAGGFDDAVQVAHDSVPLFVARAGHEVVLGVFPIGHRFDQRGAAGGGQLDRLVLAILGSR